MIYINNDRVTLPQALINTLRAELRNGVQLKYPKKYKSISKTDKGKKITEWPAARAVRYIDSVKLDLDTFLPATPKSINVQQVQVRYAKSIIFNNTTKQDEFKPPARTELGTLHEEDYEEYWFLKYCSRFVEGSANAKSNTSKNYSLVLFNPDAEAEEESDKKQRFYRVNGLIYNGEAQGGLSDAQLRDFAAAFNIAKSYELSIPALRLKLEAAVEQDEAKGKLSGDPELKGQKYFLHLYDKKVDLGLKINVRRAIDLGIVRYETGRAAWYYVDVKPGQSKGVATERIVSCEKNVAAKENVLAQYIDRNDNVKSDFLKRLAEAGKDEVDTKDEVDNLKVEAEKAKIDGDVKTYFEKWEQIVKLAPTAKHQKELDKAEKLLQEA